MTWRDSDGLGSERHSKVYIVLAGLEDYRAYWAYSEGEIEHSTISVLAYWYKKNGGGRN